MTTPDWLDELDLHAGPPAASMGTRTLDPARWLLVDDAWPAQRGEARRLLRERADDVLAVSPATTTAARALGSRIDAWLRRHAPHLVDDGHAGETDPLAAARARVAEDLCLLTPDAGGDRWLLTAGAVCFPSYWRLAEKLGRPLADVHDPVPGYPGPLANRVDAFLGRLRPGQGVWRRNWSIHAVPDLFLPAHDHGPPTTRDRWLRSEYQTLVRLEIDEPVIVFTIRTQQVPLAALAGRPDVRSALAGAIQAWSDAQLSYKGSAIDTQLLAWLHAHAG